MSFKNFIFSSVCISATYLVGEMLHQKSVDAKKPVAVDYTIKAVKNKMTLEEAVKKIPPKYGVDQQTVAVLLKKESGGNMQAERFEPHKLKDAKKYSSCPKEQKKFASSHCALQVFGLEAARRNIHWSELKDPEACIELGMAVWLEKELLCKKKLKNPTKYELLRCTAKRYNGAGPKAEQYAETFMEEYAKLTINKKRT